jgi:hypothetical protein
MSFQTSIRYLLPPRRKMLHARRDVLHSWSMDQIFRSDGRWCQLTESEPTAGQKEAARGNYLMLCHCPYYL